MADRLSYDYKMEYLASVRAPLNKTTEVIGITPEGLKIDFYLIGGEVCGPKINAKIRPEGGDWLTVRTDGVGILNVRTTFETSDGALLYVSYSGVLELGEDGYQNFLTRGGPIPLQFG